MTPYENLRDSRMEGADMMHVIGTAGHIDHGKSTLVHALTGIDPDRLPEERRRGMTIELGFAWLRLPSGREASIVDVPGHERFIRHMVAGAGGVDVALLVVAADEGMMPQTREHLAILDLLGIERGVVALTKRDLVDDEWLDLVREEVGAALAETTLRAAPLVELSATRGDGMEALRIALDAALEAAPTRPDRGRPHLAIDRIFTLAGFGTVVTGTLLDGYLEVGQEVEVVPRGARARIRGLQAHHTTLERAQPGGRVAVNLAGLSTTEVARGDVLTLPNLLPPTVRLDLSLRVVADLAAPLTHTMPVTVHTGSVEVPGRLSLLDRDELAPGAEGWVQLRLARPIAAQRGDHLIVRRPSPSATLGGGVIVDAQPQRHRRFAASVLRHLEVAATGSAEERVLDALHGEQLRSVATIATQGTLSPEEAATVLQSLAAQGTARSVGPFWCTEATWVALAARARDLLTEFHRRYPLRRGLSGEEVRGRLALSSEEWSAALPLLAATGVLDQRGETVALAGYEPRFTPAQETVAAAVRAVLAAEPYAPAPLTGVTGGDGALLEALSERGELVLLADGVYLGRAAYDEMAAAVLAEIDGQGTITVATLRDRFATSRKYALALLEHLDGLHITRRVGDARVRGSRAPRQSS